MLSKLKDWLFFAGILGVAVGVVTLTLSLLVFLVVKGVPRLSWAFILESPTGFPLGSSGGILPAIMGTLWLGAVSGIMSSLFALLTSFYLVFYSQSSKLKQLVQASLQCLAGLPSILFGLIGYTLFIYHFNMSRSLLTAALTVALMIFPFITMRLQKVLQEQPLDLMTNALSLGMSKSYTLLHLIVPTSLSEILSSIMLGVAYGMGAAAPVMYTGAVLYAETPKNLKAPFMSLPYHLYMLANDGISLETAYGTALVLVGLLFIISGIVRSLSCLREGASWKYGRRR